MTEDELNAERTKFDTASINSFVRRYGEVEGRKRYNEYVKLQAKVGCSLDYFIEKYGEKLGTQRYEELCESKGVSKKNCIEKYGKNVGTQFFKDYCKKQVKAGNTIDYYVEKYGKVEGTKRYHIVCSQKSLSLHNFKRKYGEVEGLKQYKAYISKNSVGFSRVSQELFKQIDDVLGDFANDSFFYLKNYEQEVVIKSTDDGETKIAKLDYSLNDKAIEFNGDYWHANPVLYSADDMILRSGGKRELVKDIWDREAKRTAALIKQGFKVHVVWESDYKEDPEKVVAECVNFLRGE